MEDNSGLKKCEFCNKKGLESCYRCGKSVCSDHLNTFRMKGYCPECIKITEQRERKKKIIVYICLIVFVVLKNLYDRLVYLKLQNKVAIITGSGAGIGEATAILFAQEGAKVCCNSLSESSLKITEKILKSHGEAIFVQGDVSVEEDAKKIVEKTVEMFGKIDILFNNAGIVLPGTVSTITTQDWDKTFAVNVKGTYLVSRYCIPYLKKTKGVIINNSSSVAWKGVKNRAAYTASKGAILSLSRAMAADYLEDNIRVNVICPGTTDTPSLGQRLSKYKDPKQARKDFIARQKMGRLGSPEEIAQGVLFLVLNEFCTGTSLSVDGGMTM
ncbi:MAG: glucose 1-dehydrogenase [Candidatus Lokiarchaeota archaeon]